MWLLSHARWEGAMASSSSTPPAAAAAYQDKWTASHVRSSRSCLLPLFPVVIPLLSLYSSGGSDNKEDPMGGMLGRDNDNDNDDGYYSSG